MTTSDSIKRKLFFQVKVFYCGHSKHTFHENCPSEQRDEEEPPKEQNKNREHQNLSEATPEPHQYAETLSKRNVVGQTTLLRDSQPPRKVVMRKCRETEANWRVIIRLPATRLSNNQTRCYRGKRWGRPTKQLLATKRRKFLLPFLKHPSKTKDLTQGNSYSREMPKIRMGTSRVIPKRNRAREYSNPVTKRGATHG